MERLAVFFYWYWLKSGDRKEGWDISKRGSTAHWRFFKEIEAEWTSRQFYTVGIVSTVDIVCFNVL